MEKTIVQDKIIQIENKNKNKNSYLPKRNENIRSTENFAHKWSKLHHSSQEKVKTTLLIMNQLIKCGIAIQWHIIWQ